MSWTDKIDTLLDRWHAEAEPGALAEPAFEVDPKAAPSAEWLVGETRRGLAELAEAVRESGGAPAPAAHAAGDGGGGDVRPALAEFREEIKTALTRFAETLAATSTPAPAQITEVIRPEPTGLRDEVRTALAGLRQEIGSALAGLREEIGSALAGLGSLPTASASSSEASLNEFREELKTAMADAAEENMVGRAGLTKSLRIAMADLAEKNRRAMAELGQAVSAGAAEAGGDDTVSFYPQPVDDQSFESRGEAGAFRGQISENAGRTIAVPDCYAAQVNDDSMAPLASEGQSLLVSRSIAPRNGDLVLAQLADGKWVFKRYVQRGAEHQLHSINPQLALPAVVLAEPPQRMHAVVAVLFGRVLVRVPQEAETSTAGAAAE